VKLIPKKKEDDVEPNMSPMIDMVFLLLIFFIVAAQIIDEKPKVLIPSAINAKVPEDSKNRLMITITDDEKYFIRQNLVSFEELQKYLADEVNKNPKLRVLIRADQDLKYKVSEKVMNICADVGANDLIYAVLEK
jgi:biopolymer transport protein ExbD|tara:strand:- start:1155 stop:1559 length:405 start_codon:yes stop_codon:yes gene_type:complete